MYVTSHHKQREEFLNSVHPDFQAMPLPRRWAIRSIYECALYDYAPAYQVIDPLAKAQRPVYEFIDKMNASQSIIHQLMDRNAELGQLHFLYMTRRHQLSKAPLFTVSEGLSKMLEDTGVKSDIPAKFLCPPFKTCYLEFEPYETRLAKLNAGEVTDHYPEGCYIQETVCEDLLNMESDLDVCRAMGLDFSAKTRILDIMFSYSPLKDGSGSNHYHVQSRYGGVRIAIQDEEASLTKLVSQQLEVIAQEQLKQGVDPKRVEVNAEHIKKMMVDLSKLLLYLNLNLRDQVVEKSAEALDRRVMDASPKKRAKLERQAARVYDRIIIGPKSYIPIAERFQGAEYGQGRRKPHFRRGTFGIRWKGTGEDKTPELVRISESIVNKDLMVDGAALDYEIR
jgi:hypothetical protein